MAEVRLQDVAASAGVSVSTVSNALNRPELVSAEAAARVAEAVRALGYVPNIAARQLRAGRSHVIGMAVINITNPFFADVVLGAEEAALQAGYSVIVGNSYDSTEKEKRYLELFERQRLDGVLLAPVAEDLDVLERFRRRKVPVVLVDRRDERGELPSVSLDDVTGGRLAAEHLVETGCRHLCFMGGPSTVTQMRDRLVGFRTAAEAAGVRFSVIGTETLNPTLGREIGERIAQMSPEDRPDGLFAGNDVLALGVLQSLLFHSLRVPDDIALVGYDDIEFAAAAIVPLTSVRQPSHDIGARAAELLIHRLLRPDESQSGGPETVRFEPELVIRSTTRAPR